MAQNKAGSRRRSNSVRETGISGGRRASGRSKAAKRPGKAGTRRATADQAIGFAASLEIVEADGGRPVRRIARIGQMITGKAARTAPDQALQTAARKLCRGCGPRLADTLAALGSTHRLNILTGLLEGPATYRWLQKRTGLSAGPLYHHIHQLRMEGLVGPKTRDLYVLTREGRQLLLAALSMSSLVRRRSA